MYDDNDSDKQEKLYHKLYTIYPKNHKENISVINENTYTNLYENLSVIYPNDAVLKPTICSMDCEMLFWRFNSYGC